MSSPISGDFYYFVCTVLRPISSVKLYLKCRLSVWLVRRKHLFILMICCFLPTLWCHLNHLGSRYQLSSMINFLHSFNMLNTWCFYDYRETLLLHVYVYTCNLVYYKLTLNFILNFIVNNKKACFNSKQFIIFLLVNLLQITTQEGRKGGLIDLHFCALWL